MRLADGSYINNVARLERAEEIEAESAEIDQEIKQELEGSLAEAKAEAEIPEEDTEGESADGESEEAEE